MNTALTLLLALPLLGVLYCALVGWRLPRPLSGLLASLACGAAFLAALAVLLGLLALPAEERRAEIVLGGWIDSGTFHAPFGFLVGNRGAMTGIGVSMAIGIAYLAIDPLFQKIGEFGQLRPAVAAWSPDLLFSLTGLYLLLRMKS